MINNRYIIKRKLGEGRSKVFSAIDTEFPDKEIAIKFLPVSAKPDEKDSFREEFFRLKKLEHPNIIKAFEYAKVVTKDAEDLEIEYNSEFITLEYFPSRELLEYSELIEEKKLKEILKQLCAVLYYLHQSNYIYYDLKPENILVNNIGNKPRIKLIDFGLAEYQLEELNLEVKGTAHYIAPELLRKEQHDHTIDFYSLGIILYRIVYGRFPFNASSEVDIYKAHIEQEFIFPPSKYSRELISVIKKLVQKDPKARYQDSLEILRDLGIKIDLEIAKDFIPTKFFTNRKDAVNIIRTYIADKNNTDIYCVKGPEGSGKTALLFEIYEKYDQSILIENHASKSGYEAVKYIFRKILYSSVLFENYTKELTQDIVSLFGEDQGEFIQKLKVFTDSALKNSKPIILLDDFNLYDEFVRDVFKELFPVFQMNSIKVLISENSNYPSVTELFVNIREFQITHFTDSQLSDFIEISYWERFPKRKLKKIVSLYSDLLPGNVKQFIKDLIILGILDYSTESILQDVNEELEIALQSSSEEIYRIRLSNLTAEELKLAQLISAFDISVEQTVLAGLLNISPEKLKELIAELEKKNIIDPVSLSNTPKINSASFKKYIYSTINSRKKYHLIIASSIKKLFPNFNLIELARQYELAGDYEKSALVLKKEIELAEKISAYAYKKSLLEKVLAFDLNETTKQEFLIELVRTNYKLSDYKSVIDTLEKVEWNKIEEKVKNELLLIKGICLVEMQNFEESSVILSDLTSSKFPNISNESKIWLAIIENYNNNVNKAIEILNELVATADLNSDIKTKAFNQLSMIYFYKNEFDKSLDYCLNAVEKYKSDNNLNLLAGQLVNLGNIYCSTGKLNEGLRFWDEAISYNKKIGNYLQTGVVEMNYGVVLTSQFRLEEAISRLLEAKKILKLTNNIGLYSILLENLSEAFLLSCSYDNTWENLNEAISLAERLGNSDDILSKNFLLGRFWYVIGDKDELGKIINQYEYYSYAKDSFSETHSKNYKYLKLMHNLLSDQRVDIKEILELLEQTSSDEVMQYGEILFNSIEKFISDKYISDALLLLKSGLIREISENNNYFNAYKDFLLGKIVSEEKIEGYLSSSEYFESAYNKIENESITELTWKVLVAITELYWERGNYHKAKKPRLYAIELMTMISDSITNTRIKAKYLEKKERKLSLELLKKIGDKYRVNEAQQS